MCHDAILPIVSTSGPTLERTQTSIEVRRHPDQLGQHPSDTFFTEKSFRRWYWLFVPLLAIGAYLTVLRIGFLGDDLALVVQERAKGIDSQLLLPDPQWFLYRPVGLLFIWRVWAASWVSNPFSS